MTTVPKPNDPANAFACKYDAWNRLTEVREGGIVIAEYRYDAMNRRTVKLVPHTVEEETHWHRTDVYYNLGWQGLEERFADDVSEANRGNVATAVKVQWVWSLRYIDAPVCRDRDADGQSGNGLEERLFYCTDANMNVTALVNTSGTVVERYLYDPYGRPTFMDGSWSPRNPNASAYGNAILYCGYRYAGATGLQDLRHRLYHSMLGRFNRPDPLGTIDSHNLYEYLRSRPTVGADPTGLLVWLDLNWLFGRKSAPLVKTRDCVKQPDLDHCLKGAKDRYDIQRQLTSANYDLLRQHIGKECDAWFKECYVLEDAIARQLCIYGAKSICGALRQAAWEVYEFSELVDMAIYGGEVGVCEEQFIKAVPVNCPCPEGWRDKKPRELKGKVPWWHLRWTPILAAQPCLQCEGGA